jgi:hypothetical protein
VGNKYVHNLNAFSARDRLNDLGLRRKILLRMMGKAFRGGYNSALTPHWVSWSFWVKSSQIKIAHSSLLSSLPALFSKELSSLLLVQLILA